MTYLRTFPQCSLSEGSLQSCHVVGSISERWVRSISKPKSVTIRARFVGPFARESGCLCRLIPAFSGVPCGMAVVNRVSTLRASILTPPALGLRAPLAKKAARRSQQSGRCFPPEKYVDTIAVNATALKTHRRETYDAVTSTWPVWSLAST